MDPLYVLKLKCCYLEELLEEKYDAGQVDLLKEIADLKSRLKSKGIKELQQYLNDYIPDTENEDDWLKLLVQLLDKNENEKTNENNLTNNLKLDSTETLEIQNELKDAKAYISDLEQTVSQSQEDKRLIEELKQENIELQQTIEELDRQDISPLKSKGMDNDISMLYDQSMIKSPVITAQSNSIEHLQLIGQPIYDTEQILSDLCKVLRKESHVDTLDVYRNDDIVSFLIDDIIEATMTDSHELKTLQTKLNTISNKLADSEHIKEDLQVQLSELKNQKTNDVDKQQFDALKIKVDQWKVSVMQELNDKDDTIASLTTKLNDYLEMEAEKNDTINQLTSELEDLKTEFNKQASSDVAIEETIELMQKQMEFLKIENDRLKRSTDQTNDRFASLVHSAENVHLKVEQYERESQDLLQKLHLVEQEKELVKSTLELLKEKIQSKVQESINDDNIIEKYDGMINDTERFIQHLQSQNTSLQDKINQLEDELDIAVGKTEAETLRAEKMTELIQQKEKIAQVL